MKAKRFGFKIIFMGLAALALFTTVVMLLWNALIPAIFGITAINFWQALGIFILARILFGGFGPFGHGMMMKKSMHNPIHDKWMKMTPEERKEFLKRRKEFGFGGPFGGRSIFDRECCGNNDNDDDTLHNTKCDE